MDQATFQAALNADPQYQQLIQHAQSALTHKDPGQVFNSRPGEGTSASAYAALTAYATQKAQQLGFTIPDGSHVGYDGQIATDAPWDWGKAALALTPLAAGLGLAGLGVGGGFTGAGGAAGPSVADLGPLSASSIGGSAGAVSAPLAGDVGTVAGTGIGSGVGSALATSSPLMKALAGIGGGIFGQLTSHALNQPPSQLTDLLDLATQRAHAQTPLFNAVQQGTWTSLPNYATQGLTPPKAVS